MLSKIKYLLTPPVFPDEEKTRVASILYTVLVATLIILVAATIASVTLNYVNQQIWFISWPAIIGSLLLLGLTWLARDGKVQVAGIGLVATMFLIIVGAGLDSGGVDNVSLGAFVIVIIVAGLVLGARVALATAAASIVTTLAIAYAQSSGSLVLPPSTTTPTTVYTAVFIIAGFLIFQAARNFSDALERVRAANEQLTALSTGLEERVGDRTRDLQLAAEVGRRVSRIRALDQLLPEAAELIRSRFDLYYTQIYLTDTTGQALVLRAGTGMVGQQLVRAGHRLAIDPTSINGTAASRKQAVLVEDTEKSPTFRPNALLPATRSELAVPLIAGDTVVGVLNLQSRQAGTFNQETLPAFEALSGQLATAIENANLINELTQARSEIENQARRLTREGWREFLDGVQHSQLVGYSYDGHSKRVETLAETAVEADASDMAAPISLAGAELGQIQLKLKADGSGRKQPDQSVLEAVARQVAQQVENLRLLNETARYRTEAEEALRRLTRESWANYENVTPGVVYEYDRQRIRQRVEADEGDSNGRSDQVDQLQLAQPLLIRGEPIGLLELDLPDEQDEVAVEMVTAVAQQLSSHLENLRLSQTSETALSEAQQRSKELAQINQIVTTVAGSLNLQQSLQIVADGLANMLDVDQVAIALLDEAGENLQIVADHFDRERSQSAIGISLPLVGNDLSQEILETRQSATIVDAQNHPRTALIHDALRLRGVETLYIFPIVTGNKAIGTVGIDILEKGHVLTSDQIRLAETVIFQAATAIQNSQLFDQLEGLLASAEKQAQRLAILNDLGDRFNRSQTTEEVYQLVLEHAGQLFEYDRISLLQFDSEAEQATVLAVEDNLTQELQAGMVVPLSADITERVINQRAVLRILDDEKADDDAVASSLIAPLLTGRGVLGTLNVSSKTANAYSSQDENNLLQLANYIASTLENQRLFTTVEARAQELEVLNEVARSVSHQLEPQQLMETVFNQVRRILPADIFFVAVYDAESDMVSYPYIYDDGELSSEGMKPLNPATRVYAVISSGEPVLNHLTAEEIEDIKQNQTVVLLGDDTGKVPASLLYVPLKSGNQIKGVLSIQAYASNMYTEADVTLLTGVASYAAVALENARLFEQTQDALDETETLYQASARLNAVQNYDQILDVLREHTIVGQQVNLVSLNLFDRPWTEQQQPDWIDVIAYWSQRPPASAMLAYQLADYPSAADVLRPDQATIIIDANEDKRLDDNARALFTRGYKAVSVLVVPLVSGGRWRGYISAFYGQQMDFPEADIRRLTSLASQAAVAIQSLQLLRQTEQQLANLTNIQETTSSLSAALSYNDAASTFLQQVCQAVGADSVDMYELHGEVVSRIAIYPMQPDKPVAFSCTLEKQTMMRWAVAERRPKTLSINDKSLDESLRRSFADAGIQTNVTLPLIGRSGIYGILSVNRTSDLRQFDEQELNLLQTLSDQAMIAFERVQLLEETTRRAEQEQRLREVTTRVRGSIDVDTIMRTAVQEVGRVLGRRTMIYLDQESENGREPISQPDDQVAYEMEQS
jgi:GAF domain-containing protein